MKNLNCTSIILGIIFTAAGFLFASGKLHVHLTSWKNMSPKEKEKLDIMPLCRNIGEVIMLNGLIFLMRGLWADFSEHWFTAAIIAWFLVAGVDLLYIEKAGGIKNS